jgi:molybdopterin biosynthesis enzyme
MIYELNDFQVSQLLLATNGLTPILALLDTAPDDEPDLAEKLNRYANDMEALVTIGLLEDISESMRERIEDGAKKMGRGYRALVATKEAKLMFHDADDRITQ